MILNRLAILALSLASLATASAQQDTDSVVASARQAFAEGMASVAAYKLEQIDLSKLPPDTALEASYILAQADMKLGRPERASAVLAPLGDRLPPDAMLCLADALMLQGKYADALPWYELVEKNGAGPIADEGALGRSRALMAQGHETTSLEQLKAYAAAHPSPILLLELARIYTDLQDPHAALRSLAAIKGESTREAAQKGYLVGRAAFQAGDYPAAAEALEAIKAVPPDLAVPVTLAHASALDAAGNRDSAENVLEAFIEKYPSHPDLPQVFAKLDAIYDAQDSPSSTELRRWADETATPSRRALAIYYLARNEARLDRFDRSDALYRSFLVDFPDHSLAPAARQELVSALLHQGESDAALGILADTPGVDMSFMRGLALAAKEDYQAAAVHFLAAAQGQTEEPALFNAALCTMLAGTPDDKNVPLQQFEAKFGKGGLHQGLALTEALRMASLKNPAAREGLAKLAATGSSAAQLALAEWDYQQLNFPAARLELSKVSPASVDEAERKAALDVFLLDSGEPGAAPQVIAAARQFLREHPSSPLRAEVSMKLGEMLYRQGDYVGARSVFTDIGTNFADSPFAEKAQFLAAESAARSLTPNGREDAVELYETVARQNGPLALRARLAQGLLLNALQRPDEALGVFNNILSSNPEQELRNATLIEIGDTYNSLGASDPANYQKAIDTWKTLADSTDAPHWRNQALAKMGSAYEKLGNTDAALASFYDAITPREGQETEYFWFYRAGFDAARLLETQKLYNEAIAVYSKMATLDGPRAEEARARLNKIRLENFLWEE